MKISIGILTERIASLDDEFWNHTMKDGSIKKIHLRKINKIFHVSWSVIGKEAKLNGPKLSGNGRFGIFLFELNRRWTGHSVG